MNQFFICLDNLHNVARCVRSQSGREVITIAGVPAGGGVVRMFTGIVQSIDHDPGRGSNRKWLVTLND